MPLPFLPSLTAEAVCLARALEARRPPDERLVYDPYAEHFLRRPERLLARVARLGGVASDLAETNLDPGLVGVIGARHGWIDQRARVCLPGVDQLLVLGAGYDTRSWRLELGDRLAVELDHPATARRKARRLAVIGLPPVPVVQADLAHEPLSGALSRSPLNPDAPTLIIWEGVSMYLTEAMVGATLSALCAHFPRSEVLMDVWTGSSGWYGRLERAGWLGFRVLGEPIRYTPSPSAFTALAESTGYKVVLASGVEEVAAARSRRAWPALTLAHLRTTSTA